MRYSHRLRLGAVVVPVLTVGLALTPVASAGGASHAAHVTHVTPSQAALTPREARALSTDVTDKVIVVLRDQLTAAPDTPADASRRAADATFAQRGVVADLTETGARNVKSIALIDAVAATVSPGEAVRLAANPAVAEVVKDEEIRAPEPAAVTGAGANGTAGNATAAAGKLTPLPAACAPKGKVQLDPEALETIHADAPAGTGRTAASLGYTGAGVKVGFIADGLDIDNPDFIRADGQHVFVDYQDFSGTGTNAPTGGAEAFIDSSSVAAQGRYVYNVASYGVGLSRPCLIRVRGVAPGASLVGLNVFGSAQFVFNSVLIEAVNYAVTVDHVNVLNESLGSNPFPDVSSLDLSKLANDAAVKAGVTVTVSAGDSGVTDTIGTPATDPAVISAGASTTYRGYAQTGYPGSGITAPGVKGWIDNNISGLSSAGFDQNGHTDDVVAPGDLNWTLCTADLKLYADCSTFADKPSAVQLQGGTSEAAPLTAGVAALVIQAYARTHGGRDPSPAVVKQIIVSTAEDISAPAEQQGAGLVDAYQAVLAAASYAGATTAGQGHAVLDGAGQLNAVGASGTTETLPETLTNDGSGPVTLALSTRTLAPYRPVSTESLALTKGNGFARTVTFEVPAGQGRLNASVALTGLADLSLVAPDGDLAEFNLPQGFGNYGNAQVADPAPGRWTALISTLPGPATVPVRFQAATAVWQELGSLSTPSVTLAPGASQTVTLTTSIPAQAGDTAGSIIVKSSATTPPFAEVTSIPVTLRALAATPDPSTTFTGTLTGGNGRATDTGQTAYYQVAIPAGTPVLNADVSTGNAANTFLAELIDPVTHEAASTAGNRLLQTGAGGQTSFQPQPGAQLHVVDPRAGVWTLVVDFFNAVSGTAVAQPFTVTLDDSPAAVTVAGLPDSPATTLVAGTPVTVGVQVTNNGTSPEAYFVDARLDTETTVKLVGRSTSLLLPDLSGTVPNYFVPSHTTSITSRVSSSKPLFYDYAWTFGDPDLISNVGKTATGTLTAAEIAPGDWTVTPFLVGPTGVKPARSVPATTSMTATIATFDAGVTSPAGDLWWGSVRATNGFNPYVVDPGQTVTIPVTIVPKGTPGTVVTGTLYVDDSSFLPSEVTYNELAGHVPEGSDVAALAYSYKVG